MCVTISTLREAGIIKLTARSIKTWSEHLHVDLTVPGSDGADGENRQLGEGLAKDLPIKTTINTTFISTAHYYTPCIIFLADLSSLSYEKDYSYLPKEKKNLNVNLWHPKQGLSVFFFRGSQQRVLDTAAVGNSLTQACPHPSRSFPPRVPSQ